MTDIDKRLSPCKIFLITLDTLILTLGIFFLKHPVTHSRVLISGYEQCRFLNHDADGRKAGWKYFI